VIKKQIPMPLKALLTLIVSLMITSSFAQQSTPVYDPGADAGSAVQAAVTRAGAEGRHVFVQIGYNACSWCMKFHKMVKEDAVLDSLLHANYEVVYVNCNKENYNAPLLAGFGYPQRFGFPVFVILDSNGKVLNTQDSWFLEQDKGYSREKVEHFFRMWSPFTLKQAAQKYGK
jgi:thioredoxin-related protein